MKDKIGESSDFDSIDTYEADDILCYCPKSKKSYNQFRYLPNGKDFSEIIYSGVFDEDYDLDYYLKNTYNGCSLICIHKCRQCFNETFLIKHTVDEESPTFVYSTSLQYDISCVLDGINYYMGQVFKSKSAGAYSVAMVMYRSALEFLLYHSGLNEGRLVDKIKSFEDKPPDWATSLNSKFMDIIRELGNDSVHSNGGDISEQEKFDFDMLEAVEIALNELIERAYILPQRKKERLSVLSKASRNTN